MRIDSSGNLLVGMTSNGITSTGIGLVPDGISHMYSGGTHTLELGRGTNDGDILKFNRSGTPVGSIRSISADSIGIGNGVAGLRFVSGTNRIQPVDMTNGLNSDALTDLGDTNKRFQDLFLSGGVYLGGTGSANKLDDYEEGTWTPNIDYGGTDGTMSSASGVYTKVGRIVHCSGMLVVSSTNGGTGNAFLTGLPFTVGDLVSSTGVEASGVISYFASMGESVGTMSIAAINGQTYCEIYKGTSGTGAATANHTTFAATAQIRFSISYATT